MFDDRTLLAQFAAQRTEAAFAELVRRHLDAVYSAALRRVAGDTHLAEDVAQQVFTALAAKAAVVARHPAPSAWLYIATRHEAANAVRAERRRRAREQEAPTMSETLPDAETAADWSRVAPVLDAAIDELNDRDRTAILLRFADRRSFPEIAAALAVSDDAARMRVERALDKLRSRLGRRGITSTAAALGVALAHHAVSAAPAGLAGTVTATAAATLPAAGLATAIGILEIMSTTKTAAGIVAVALVAAVGISTREFAARRDAAAALAAASTEQAVLAAKLRGSEERAARAEAATADLERALAEAHAARRSEQERLARARTTAASATAGPVTPEAIAAGQALIARHPDLKQAVTEYCRALFGGAVDPLARERNLTPAQREQVEDYLMLGSGILRRVAGPNGEPMVVAGIGFGDAERKRAAGHELAWLGAEGGQQLRQGLAQEQNRALTVQLAGALAFSTAGLTPAQTQEFTRIVSAAGGRSGQGTFNWTPILAQAADLLTGPQLAMLRGFQTQEQYQLAMSAAMRRRGQAAANSTGGKP